MKKNGIQIMLAGLLITLITAFFFFTSNETSFINNFVITYHNTFHFNFAPMIGLIIMAIGEFLLWESQENENLVQVWNRFAHAFKEKVIEFKLSFNFLSLDKIQRYKLYSFILLLFKL